VAIFQISLPLTQMGRLNDSCLASFFQNCGECATIVLYPQNLSRSNGSLSEPPGICLHRNRKTGMVAGQSASAFGRERRPQVRGSRSICRTVAGTGDRTVETQTSNLQDRPRLQVTYGEILTNGVVIELIRSEDKVTLLRWDGKNYEIKPQFHDGSTIYQAPFLQPSVFEATRFPCGVGADSPLPKLFWKVSDLFCHYMGFPREWAAFMTGVVFGSWLPDCGARPITLCITGGDMDRAMRVFRLLHVLCRRPLVVAELSLKLPLMLCPTLLVNMPGISRRTGSLWRASSYRRAFIPDVRGEMRSIACSKIVFCETEAARDVWGPETMSIALLPTTQELPALTEQEEAQLAAEYQPRLLAFRLRSLSLMHESGATSRQAKPVGFELGGKLPASIAENPEIVKILTPLLEARAEELRSRRSLDPRVAIVEAVWAAAHKEKEMSTAQITQRVNALLHSRGDFVTYNPNQIGWKLRDLGLNRRHNGKGKVVPFCPAARYRIHQLAMQFGLKLPKVAGCVICKGT
jgi:hypothetical protein